MWDDMPVAEGEMWDQFVATVDDVFPGDPALPAKRAILATATKGGQVPMTVRTYSGYARELDGLGRVNKAWRRWRGL